jgi:hypothetical protein
MSRGVLQAHGRTMMRAAIAALSVENEVNALLALRVVDSLHKGRRSPRPPESGMAEDPLRLDDFIAPYLHLVQSVLNSVCAVSIRLA